MAITRLAHVCLNVKNAATTIDFYTRVLGLKQQYQFLREDGSVRGAYFDAGNGSFIEFFESEKDLPPTAKIAHMCLQVDDIDASIADIRSAGWEITEKKLGCDQSWQAWVVDPDGIRIELHEYTENSSQLTGEDRSIDW